MNWVSHFTAATLAQSDARWRQLSHRAPAPTNRRRSVPESGRRKHASVAWQPSALLVRLWRLSTINFSAISVSSSKLRCLGAVSRPGFQVDETPLTVVLEDHCGRSVLAVTLADAVRTGHTALPSINTSMRNAWFCSALGGCIQQHSSASVPTLSCMLHRGRPPRPGRLNHAPEIKFRV